jgi:multidrug efflux pump subunit AcrA (membrane-fusion protein)
MKPLLQVLFALVFLGLLIGGGIMISRQWEHRSTATAEGHDDHGHDDSSHDGHDHHDAHAEEGGPARLSPQAQKNLGLYTRPAKLTDYWSKLELPGVITDRPGISDRGVTAPVVGVITEIHAYPGDTVQPNSPLFTIRLISESIHAAQLELFKSKKEIEISQNRKNRLSKLVESGSVAKSQIIDIENQIERMEVTIQAYRQDLKARGFTPDQMDAAEAGDFVTEFTIRAPTAESLKAAHQAAGTPDPETPEPMPFAFELQDLKVALGQQVEAGAVLCFLADHRSLLIEGRGFKDDMPLIQEAARKKLPIEVEFETSGGDWPSAPNEFVIHHVANTIDLQTRTFSFYMVLENQGRAYDQQGLTRMLWRFRPGDRVRLRASVDKFENVFVVPQAAVVKEGPEAFVFRQNGDLFDRKPVHILLEDRTSAVLADDGSLRPGFPIAQNGAASINRVLKAQNSVGEPAGGHSHSHD